MILKLGSSQSESKLSVSWRFLSVSWRFKFDEASKLEVFKLLGKIYKDTQIPKSQISKSLKTRSIHLDPTQRTYTDRGV